MAESNLEQARERFSQELALLNLDLSVEAGYEAYWHEIGAQAQETKDVDQLERWLTTLSRDKDRLALIRERQREAAAGQQADLEILQMIMRLLALLDDVGSQLRRRIWELRSSLGWWVLLAGMGRKSKPKPVDDEDQKPEEKKAEQAKKAALARKRQPKKPTKTKGT